MTVDPAFENAGQNVGLEIWRIERCHNSVDHHVVCYQMGTSGRTRLHYVSSIKTHVIGSLGTDQKLKVVRQDPKTYGEFYSGDSYIILSTKKRKNSSKLEWDLHFWLGNNTSQDEKGVAAYKTVELDDSLGGGPVQYREVQEHESKLFLSYFKHGIKYLEGGIESGFKKVERGKYETRLMHVKGKRNIRVKQVKCDISSLNQGDVFILDCGLVIFTWNGPDSSKMERIKAAEVARRIKDEERGGKAVVNIIEERWDTDPAFFKALGSVGTIAAASEAGDDRDFENASQLEIKLYRVTDSSGKLEVNEVGCKPLTSNLLDSNYGNVSADFTLSQFLKTVDSVLKEIITCQEVQDCFILDSGSSGIYAWIGKKCTKNERKSAWKNATDFLSLRGYPDWTPVTQVVEGGETPLFKQYFSSWIDPDAQTGMGIVHRTEKVAKYNTEKFNSSLLHQKSITVEEYLPDDGSGHIQIWRVENKDLVPQPEDTYGIFYTGDCYVILYTYSTSGRESNIIYFWQGTKSSTDERGASAIFAQQLDDNELNGSGIQIRVVQGREPEHFLRIFQGKMIILLGGIKNEEPDSPIRIFQVRGTKDFNTKAVQVLPRAASLNSNDAFIIESEAYVHLWYGKGASLQERKMAKNLLSYLCPDRHESEFVEVNEDEEMKSFWELIGGIEPYATGKRLERNQDMPPRLFLCSNASGRFNVEEIVDFTQEDLIEDDVMILDTIDEVYVWVGNTANAIEKKESLSTAMEYIKSDPTGRNPDNTVILQVKQGLEPPSFTGYFMAWDTNKWSHGKTYDDLKRELGQENVEATSVQQELADFDKKHPYSELIKKIPPKGVDPSCKEMYLTDAEFQKIFKMSPVQYSSLKQWKQLDLKKKVGLF